MPIGGNSLVIDTIDVDGQSVIALTGEIDVATAPALTAAIEECLRRAGTVVLDFAGVTFMDSSGLNVLVATSTRRIGSHDAVLIRNASARVVQLMNITGLDALIRLEDNADDVSQTTGTNPPSAGHQP